MPAVSAEFCTDFQATAILQGRGCAAIATEYLDGIGYEVNSDDEIVKISLDELNDIYAKLH